MKICDIYAGKPDAGDEIREKGYDEFANSYIEPSGVNIARLASAEYGTPFFIMGDKGTGKTALLYFLQSYIYKIDSNAFSSFVFFDSGYNGAVRNKFTEMSRSISSSVAIDNGVASIGQNIECDFIYIWKWQFYQKIIADNDSLEGVLFDDDNNWRSFVNELNKVSKSVEKGKMRIPTSISFGVTSNPQLGTITPAVKIEPIDLSQRSFNRTKEYTEFIRIIDNADRYARLLVRSDIPYYIFIDELEAYRGDNDTFYRDLRLIRDLLFTVKNLNDVFHSGTKFICSVRPEILYAINRFVQPNQLHKIMQGYDEKLVWEHTNTNSFSHPIINVLLKRIANAERYFSGKSNSQEILIKEWFQTKVYNMHVCSYILENTWHKPRDIVRLLLSAQSKGSKNFSTFNQSTFDTFMPAYSKQCLVEIKEEMRALYDANDIDCIFSCLQGFKMFFSYNEISDRAKRLYPNGVFATKTVDVLRDMYRIGVIGNFLYRNQSPRWEYKEQYCLNIDAPWMIIIHHALRIELGVNGRIDRFLNEIAGNREETPVTHQAKSLIINEGKDRCLAIPLDSNTDNHSSELNNVARREKDGLATHQIYSAIIREIEDRCVLVSFTKDGIDQPGYIFMGNLGIQNVEAGSLSTLFFIGQVINVELIGYANYISRWLMRRIE